MGMVKVMIQDLTAAKKNQAELPDDVQMRRLIPALVTKLSLPVMQAGNPINYALDHKRTGKRLRDEDTLSSAGVQTDDILTVVPNVTAGSGPGNPRLRRLQSDYERLQQMVAQSDLIRIAGTEGNPPEKYVIQYTCRGIERLNGDQPVYSEFFQMGIYLSAGYPTGKPSLMFLTPIFHPNIHKEGTVCIGAWWAAKWLDELVFHVAEMVQYKSPPTDPNDPFNTHAAAWYTAYSRTHSHLFPVDHRDVKSVGDNLMDLIRIGAGPSRASDDDIIDIKIL